MTTTMMSDSSAGPAPLVLPEIPFRRRATIGASATFAAEDGRSILLVARVLRALCESVRSDPGVEHIGLLVGRLFHDDDGTYAVVTSAARSDQRVHDDVHAVATSEHVEAAEQRLAAADPAATRIGWWHSHVGPHPDLSETDRRTQLSWRNSYSVCVLAFDATWTEDPRLTVFVGPEGTETRETTTGHAKGLPRPGKRLRRNRNSTRKMRPVVLRRFAALAAAIAMACGAAIGFVAANARSPQPSPDGQSPGPSAIPALSTAATSPPVVHSAPTTGRPTSSTAAG